MLQEPEDAWRTHMVCLAAEQSMLQDGRRLNVDFTRPTKQSPQQP
jgi:hypothetical protein